MKRILKFLLSDYLNNYEEALFTCLRSEKCVFSVISATKILRLWQEKYSFPSGTNLFNYQYENI
jgi:hypothetical protein